MHERAAAACAAFLLCGDVNALHATAITRAAQSAPNVCWQEWRPRRVWYVLRQHGPGRGRQGPLLANAASLAISHLTQDRDFASQVQQNNGQQQGILRGVFGAADTSAIPAAVKVVALTCHPVCVRHTNEFYAQQQPSVGITANDCACNATAAAASDMTY